MPYERAPRPSAAPVAQERIGSPCIDVGRDVDLLRRDHPAAMALATAPVGEDSDAAALQAEPLLSEAEINKLGAEAMKASIRGDAVVYLPSRAVPTVALISAPVVHFRQRKKSSRRGRWWLWRLTRRQSSWKPSCGICDGGGSLARSRAERLASLATSRRIPRLLPLGRGEISMVAPE